MNEPIGNVPELTVSELSSALKRTVEDRFGQVRVRGEISGWRGPHSSGHAYFSLKDQNAKLDAVIWKGAYGRIRTKLAEGLDVVATGKLTTFPGSSKYQIVIESIEVAGIGALMQQVEERRKRLAAEGLFDAARKRPIPFLPQVIGVVTSPTGAVIRDILHRLAERFPRDVLVWPVRVQGETAADEVAAAIRGFNAIEPGGPVPRPDVLIVARGGGSLEDLMAFNEEIVVRAAAESAIPLIAAIGHETDTTLIDFAADLRAPTPTGAAEKSVPVRADLLAQVANFDARRVRGARRLLDMRLTQLRNLARVLPGPDEMVAGPRQQLDRSGEKLARSAMQGVERRRARVLKLTAVLAHHSPRAEIESRRGSIKAAYANLRRLGAAIFKERADLLVQRDRNLQSLFRARLRTEAKSLEIKRRDLDRVQARLPLAMRDSLNRRAKQVRSAAQLLGTLGYRQVLARGFALVRDGAGEPVRLGAGIASGQALSIEFADRKVAAHADGEASKPPRAARSPSGGQGGLFD